MFMYVMILKCDFGALDEVIVSSLIIWTRIALENSLWFSFSFANLGWVSSGKITEDSSWLFDARDFYAGQLFFFDKNFQKAEGMESKHFWIWRSVPPLRVMEDRRLVNFDACEYFSGNLRSGHCMIPAEGWSYE